jgi:gamma-D-glutamyl-L-lysine dipeptidyl-peptidase
MAGHAYPSRWSQGVAPKASRRAAWLMATGLTAIAMTLAGEALVRLATSTSAASGSPGSAAPAVMRVTPRPCTSGTCWIAVSVSTMWVKPWFPRPVDAPALANPARPREWVATMTLAQKQWLQGRLESQTLYGTKAVVIDHHGPDWTKIAVPSQPTDRDSRGYPGWVPTRQLTSTRPPAATTTAIVRTATAWLWSGWSASGTSGNRVIEVSYDTRLPVVSATSTYVQVQMIGGRKVAIARSRVALHTVGTSWGGTGASVVAQARQFVGLQYLWAGTAGFGFDCSGFTHSLFAAYGVIIPRDANRQAVHGRPISAANLRPGDLVFFREGPAGPIGHVGLYVGNGEMIDAPHTGAPIRYDSVWSWGGYAGARRYLG